MSSYLDHQNLIKRFIIDAQKEIPGIRIFERHVGLFYRKNGKPIKINQKGMADCYALYQYIHVEIEAKTGNAQQTKEQKIWQKFIESNNGIYMVIREDYHDTLTELKNRLESLINKTSR